MRNLRYENKDLERIWLQVPPDYYQNAIQKNPLQRAWHSRKLRNILEMINREPKNILDIGCASGWFLSEVAKKFPKSKSVGVDCYERAIEYGKKRYKNLKLILADAHSLPFADNSFDIVICAEVLEHVVSPDRVLAEIRRVLKKGGIGIIEMDSGNFVFKVIWYFWTNLRKGVWKDSHIQNFDSKKLKTMLLKNGFKISDEKNFNYSMAVLYKVHL